MTRQVGEAHADLLPLAGVDVRLVGQRVPHRALARRGAGGRGRDVGVDAAREKAAAPAGAGIAQAALGLLAAAEAAGVDGEEGGRTRRRRPAEIGAQKLVAIRRVAQRQAGEVAHAA